MRNIDSEKTEIEILNAEKEVFQQKGMAGARMQEIADRANINKALLHYYFRSKQLLFEAVFKNAFNLLAPQIGKVLNDDTDLFEKIRNFTNNYVSFVSKHPYLPNFVIQELNRNPEFIEKLRASENFPSTEKFKLQAVTAINEGKIRTIESEQLLINIIAMNIFPFIGEPLLMALTNVDKKKYDELLQNRKTEAAEFIINAIKI